MQAAQRGDPSPKSMNCTSSASSLKASSAVVQNSTTTCIPTEVKGKKRERLNQGPEHGRRERRMKADGGDSGPCTHGSLLKIELEKITDQGRLIDSKGVEKLVQHMILYKNDKIDLAGRSLFAGVIAATDKYDCLSQFVHLRGLLVLDEWLQEIHKGKIGDLSGTKDSEKSIEEFLFVLLRALEKLPVNLQALQTCNIGRSVNHLRSHMNVEIQKKVRGLVDTWKKRVEAEININDSKSGLNQAASWPVRSQDLGVSHGRCRQSGASSEVVFESSVSHLPSSKAVSCSTVQGETTSQSSLAHVSADSLKLLPPTASSDANEIKWQPGSANVSGGSDLPCKR